MALNGFFPKDIYGVATSVFTDFSQALPIITFLLSVGASAFGSSKFFLEGPLRLLSHEAPCSGMLSLTFLATLFVNTGFIFRVYAIEHTFFSKFHNYTYEHSIEKSGTITTSIDPLLSHEFRLLIYFLPALPSLLSNLYSLKKELSYGGLLNLFLSFPQYVIAPCFFPLMFQGTTRDDPEEKTRSFKIKVWRVGSLINTIYIILLPQIILVLSDVMRGVTNWKFKFVKDSYDAFDYGFLEQNSSLLKHQYGNIIFSIIGCVVYTGALSFLAWKITDLFQTESDRLAIRPHDKDKWVISWIRETSSQYSQTHDVEVCIRT